MIKAAIVAVASFALLQGSLLAQRASGGARGGGAAVHFGGGRGGARRGVGGGGFHRRNGTGSFFSPYSPYFDGFEPEGEAGPVAKPQMVIQRSPDPPIPNAQVIEVPAFATSNIPKVLPQPAIFILANGERLESRRFLLTASLLSVSIDRENRNVPLALLDIKSTVAANHERGIELRIPDDGNEISLGF